MYSYDLVLATPSRHIALLVKSDGIKSQSTFCLKGPFDRIFNNFY